MQTILNFLQKSPILFLATIGEDGKPKNRPFRFLTEDLGMLYFGTGASKKVYAELLKNPYIEFSSVAPDYSWARISGRMSIIENLDLKEKILAKNGELTEIYGDASNPEFVLLTLKEGSAIIYDPTLENGAEVVVGW